MKKRQAARAGVVIAGLLGVIVLGAVLLSCFRQQIARLVADAAVHYVGHLLSVKITYRRFSGNLLRTPRFEDVGVVFGKDSVKASEITFSYDPLGFLRGSVPISEVEIRNPTVFIHTQSRAGDRERTSKTGWRIGRYPRWYLRRLHLDGGMLFMDNELRLESLALNVRAHSRVDLLKAELRGGRGKFVRENISLQEMHADLIMTADSLVLEQLGGSTSGSNVVGRLSINLSRQELTVVLDSVVIDLAEFVSIPGRIGIKGSGTKGAVRLEAEGNYVIEGLRPANVCLPRIAGKLSLCDKGIVFEAAGADSELGSLEARGTFELKERRYSVELKVTGMKLSAIRPSFAPVRMTFDLQARGYGGDSVAFWAGAQVPEVGVETLLVSGRYFRNRFGLKQLELRGGVGRLTVSGEVELGGLGSKIFLLSIPACSVKADSFDLGLIAGLWCIPVAGTLRGILSGAGTVDSFALQGSMRASGVKLFGLGITSALAEVDVTVNSGLRGRLVLGAEGLKGMGIEADAAQFVLLDSDVDFRIDRPEDRVLVGGNLSLTKNRIECEVRRLEFATREETLTANRPFEFYLDKDSVLVRGVSLRAADGELQFQATVGARVRRVEAKGSNFNLRKLQKLLHLPTEVWGTCDFEVSGQDTYHLRTVVNDLEVPSIGMRMKNLTAELAANDSWVEIRDFRFVHVKDTTRVHGSFSYNPAHGLVPRRVSIQADIADPGSWPMFFLRPTLELVEGKLFARLSWEGDVSEPNLKGRFRVVSGRLKVPALNLVLERTNAEFSVQGKRIELEKLSGTTGAGLVTASGFVDLDVGWLVDSLRFRIRPEGTIVNPLPEVYAVIGGDIAVVWQRGSPLSLEGTFDVAEALLAIGFGQSAIAGSSTDSVIYDLRIRAERGVWLRNPMADIEMSADLFLRRTMERQMFSGTLKSRQGSIYYLDHTLRVTRGTIGFEGIERLDPTLDIEAELPVRSRSRAGGRAPDKIILHIAGSLEKPEFKFSAEPQLWDEGQIIAYLGLNVTAADVELMDNTQRATQYLSERLLAYLQTEATKQVRRFVGLDELRFESVLAGGEGYRVTVGKYVGRNLYVTYTQNLAGVMQPAFSIEYYLDRRNEIVGEKSPAGRYSIRYRYKLRY